MKKKSVLDKIINYLNKQTHENVVSLYLNGYNGNNILVRFDYVKSMSAFKIVWIDLNYVDVKKFEQYINMQIVTKYLATKLTNIVDSMKAEQLDCFDEDIWGDRVELYINSRNGMINYNFDRFLPKEWNFLADILVIIFSYLPRNMEVFLNEMFGKLDNLEEAYNSKKPVRIDMFDDESVSKYFKPIIINRGKKYYEQDRVLFLDKIDKKYVALVEGTKPHVVLIEEINDDFTVMICNCEYNGFCKHTYAVIEAIRNNDIKKFYKVKRNNNKSLLENITNIDYELSVGVADGDILLITNDGQILREPILDKGKSKFKVIEDDDNLSLSKYISDLEEK